MFKPVSVRRGALTRVDYYVGSTGAEISIEACGGSIHEHTQAATLDANYTNTTRIQRHAALTLTPAVTAKTGPSEIDMAVGSITRDSERSFAVKFASEERSLAPIAMGDSIKWTITLPRGEKVIRDFLIGNLYLFAKCTWQHPPRSGQVFVCPSDVRFFDSDRRPLTRMGSLLMMFVLWVKGIRIEHVDGFAVKFEVEPT